MTYLLAVFHSHAIAIPTPKVKHEKHLALLLLGVL